MIPAAIWVAKYWKQAAAAVAGLILFLYVTGLKSHIGQLESDLDGAVKAVTICELERGQLRGAVDDQNEAIRRLQQEGLKQQRAFQRAQREIGRIKENNRRIIEDIDSAPIEPTCEGALESLRQRARGLAEWDH